MTRVCHLTSVHSSTDTRIFHKECSSLARAGYDTYLVAPGSSSVMDGVSIVGVPTISGGRLSRMTKQARAVYRTGLKIDAALYHIHDPELLPYALTLKRRGKVVVFDSHEFYGLQIREKKHIPRVLRNTLASIYTKFEEYVNERIDATIEVCTVSGRDLFEGRCKRRVFITNAPHLDEFAPTYSTPFEERQKVAYIGALTHERGITHLIEGVSQTKATLVLGGKLSEHYQAVLRTLPAYSRVDYRGFLTRKEIGHLLDGCFAGVATLLDVGQYGRIDTLPTKVYEYMVMALPVIVSRSPYASKVLDQYQCGIAVDPSDPGEIAKAVNYLLEHPKEAQEMGQNGRRAVLEDLSWDVEQKKLLALYEELLGEALAIRAF